MGQRRSTKQVPVEATELEAKTIRFHRGVWAQVQARAGHVNPTEWLRAEIYSKILGLRPEDLDRQRAA